VQTKIRVAKTGKRPSPLEGAFFSGRRKQVEYIKKEEDGAHEEKGEGANNKREREDLSSYGG